MVDLGVTPTLLGKSRSAMASPSAPLTDTPEGIAPGVYFVVTKWLAPIAKDLVELAVTVFVATATQAFEREVKLVAADVYQAFNDLLAQITGLSTAYGVPLAGALTPSTPNIEQLQNTLSSLLLPPARATATTVGKQRSHFNRGASRSIQIKESVMCNDPTHRAIRAVVQAYGTPEVRITGNPSALGGMIVGLPLGGPTSTPTFYLSLSAVLQNSAMAYLSLALATGERSTSLSVLAIGDVDFMGIGSRKWSG